MYKNPHIDSVERNGVGIFRVLNWQAGAFVSKIIRVRIIQLRIIYSFLRKTSMIVPSGMASIYRRMLTFEGCSFGERTKRGLFISFGAKETNLLSPFEGAAIKQGFPCRVTNITNLFLSLRRGFEPLSKSLANRWQET